MFRNYLDKLKFNLINICSSMEINSAAGEVVDGMSVTNKSFETW